MGLKFDRKYKLVMKISKEAFGEVFMVQDISNGELVVVKVEDGPSKQCTLH